jgi:hypothetical protein
MKLYRFSRLSLRWSYLLLATLLVFLTATPRAGHAAAPQPSTLAAQLSPVASQGLFPDRRTRQQRKNTPQKINKRNKKALKKMGMALVIAREEVGRG